MTRTQVLDRIRSTYARMTRASASLEEWRDWLTYALLLLSAIAFVPSMLITFPTFLAEARYGLIAMDVAAWILAVAQLFFKGSTFRFRAYLWLAVLYCLIISYYAVLGPHYARSAWLVGSAVFSAVIFGTRAAFVSTAINAAMLVGLYWLVDPADPAWTSTLADPWSKWAMFVVNVSAITLFSSLPVGLLLGHLGRALGREQQARRELALESAHLQGVMESLPGIFYTCDQGRLVRWNRQLEEVLGYSVKEVGDLHAPDLFAPEDRERIAQAAARALAEGQVDEEALFVTRDGRKIPHHWIASRVTVDGKPYLIGIAVDISDRQSAEASVRESEEKYRELVENLSIIVYTVDASGIITYVSSAVEPFLEYRPSEIVGRPFAEFVYPQDLQHLIDNHRKAMTGQPLEPSESRILTRSGQVRWMHTSSRPTFEGDRVTGLQGTLLDITDRREAEAGLAHYREQLEERVQERTAELETRVAEVETLNRALTNVLEDLQEANVRIAETAQHLQEANDELESFSYSVSHDLRAPLRHIDGFVRLLAKHQGDQLDNTSSRYLEIIHESVAKMSRLIEDLLTLSRTGRTEMQLGPVHLNKVVRSAQQELKAETQDRQIDWQIAPLPTVEGDPVLLRQVWVNLLSNAVKYTQPREHACIEVGVLQEGTTSATPVIPSAAEESPNSCITLYVRDNGVGFDPRYTHKLFGVFQRLHPSGEFEGTGIGLAIVRRIVHRHGGRVWAEGAPDRGATFYLTLKTTSWQASRHSARTGKDR